jgi:hypothetical protein
MELNQLNQMLNPSNLLLLGVGLQAAAVLMCWLIAEARVGDIGSAGMQLAPLPTFSKRVASQRYAEPASIVQMRQPAYARRVNGGSAMIERDAA